MKIRFDVNDTALRESFLRTHFLEALAPLAPLEPPRWGHMTAPQMVEHLLWTVELSTGHGQVECLIPPEKRERMKTFLYQNRPMPPDFMNPVLTEGLPALRFATLPEATAALRAAVDRFLDQAARDPATARTHPVFGPLGAEEWSRTHFKHFCHHLLQFGLIVTEPPAGV